MLWLGESVLLDPVLEINYSRNSGKIFAAPFPFMLRFVLGEESRKLVQLVEVLGIICVADDFVNFVYAVHGDQFVEQVPPIRLWGTHSSASGASLTLRTHL